MFYFVLRYGHTANQRVICNCVIPAILFEQDLLRFDADASAEISIVYRKSAIQYCMGTFVLRFQYTTSVE